MKICWDRLEEVHLTRNGTFVKGTYTYIYKEICAGCGEPYLTSKDKQSDFCGHSCVNKGRRLSKEHKKKISIANTGRTHTVEARKKISIANASRVFSTETRKKMSIAKIGKNHPMYGKTHTVETKKKISIANTGKVPTFEARKKMSKSGSRRGGVSIVSWKGDVKGQVLTVYKTHKDKLGPYEEIRKQKGTEALEVRCAYCGRWYTPTYEAVRHRLVAINYLNRGEQRFYCSENCKLVCPIYNQTKYPKGFKHTTSREVSPYLRQMVLERDNWTCQICGKTIKEVQLHVHHTDPVRQHPMFQNDMDSCITLCKGCHKMVHSVKGCRYVDLQCKTQVENDFNTATDVVLQI